MELVGYHIVYELDYRKPVLYVIPIQSILGKLPVVPVGDTGTILYHLHNVFPGAPGDRRPGSGDGCRMCFVNSWALGWSRDRIGGMARDAACNNVAFEHGATPCSGHAVLCPVCRVRILFSFLQQYSCWTTSSLNTSV